MKLHIVFYLAVLLVFPGMAFSEDGHDPVFEQANDFFSRGEFEKASELYEEITAAKGYAEPVLFNLANSYAQSGRTGKAILNYERAVVLAPSDPDIKGNLEKVRKENGLFLEPPEGLDKVFSKLSLNQWSTLVLAGLILAVAALLISLKLQFTRIATVITSSSCLLLLAFGSTGTVLRYKDFNPSIVTSPGAKLLVSPFEASASTGAIQEGRRVFPLKDHGDYSYVEDSSGRKGWLPVAALESVCGRPN